MSAPPSWLRGISFSYAILADEDPDRDPRAAIHPGLCVPLLFTRVGQEFPALAEGQQQFLDRSAELGLLLSIINVPQSGHAFDAAEATADSQEAVAEATQLVIRALNRDL